jgi:deazaflavin-dependent oxidoreductase (nitroreductase family)
LSNVRANPEVEAEVAGDAGVDRFTAQARVVASGPERDELYSYMTEVWPAFADYEAKTDRTIPVVVLTRVR